MKSLSKALSNIDHLNVFKKNPLPILIFRVADQAILKVNPAAESAYGFNLNEFTKLKFTELFPDKESVILDGLMKDDPFKIPQQGVWRNETKNGKIIHVSFHFFEIQNSKNIDAVLTLNFVHDFDFLVAGKSTDQKLGFFRYIQKDAPTSEEINWVQRFYNYVVANMDENITVEELSFHLSQSLRTVNRYCKSITGYTPSQLIQDIKLSWGHLLWSENLVKNKKQLAKKIGYKDVNYTLKKLENN